MTSHKNKTMLSTLTWGLVVQGGHPHVDVPQGLGVEVGRVETLSVGEHTRELVAQVELLRV